MQRFRIEFCLYQTSRNDRFDLRSKNERCWRILTGWNERVVERLDADVITHQCQGAILVVPHCEREHSVETTDTIRAPLGEGSQQYFGITLGVELVSETTELFTQFTVVVDLAVIG